MIPQSVVQLAIANLIFGLVAGENEAAPEVKDVEVSETMSNLFDPESLPLDKTSKLLSALSQELDVRPESAGRSGLTKEMIDQLLRPQRFFKLHCDYPHMSATKALAASPAGQASASLRSFAIDRFLDCKSALDGMISMQIELLSEEDESLMEGLLAQVAGSLAIQPGIVEFVTTLNREELVKRLVRFLMNENSASSPNSKGSEVSIKLFRLFEHMVGICSTVAGDITSSISIYEPFLAQGMPAFENKFARRWLTIAKLCRRIVDDEKHFREEILNCYDTNCAK